MTISSVSRRTSTGNRYVPAAPGQPSPDYIKGQALYVQHMPLSACHTDDMAAGYLDVETQVLFSDIIRETRQGRI